MQACYVVGAVMKLSGKILKFKKKGDSWLCLNKGAGYEVGVIYYLPLWKSWVFDPHPANRYSVEMVSDVKDFMEQLN